MLSFINIFLEFQRKVFQLLEGIRYDQKLLLGEQMEQKRLLQQFMDNCSATHAVHNADQFNIPVMSTVELQALYGLLQDSEKKESLVNGFHNAVTVVIKLIVFT